MGEPGWKYSKGGVLSARVTEAVVASLIRSGELQDDDSVWGQELGTWQPVAEVREWILSRAQVPAQSAAASNDASSLPAAEQVPAEVIASPAVAAEAELRLVPPIAPPPIAPAPQPVAAPFEPWKYSKDSRIAGPVSKEQIATMIRAGELANDDQVWSASLGMWSPVSDVGARLLQEVPVPVTVAHALPRSEPAHAVPTAAMDALQQLAAVASDPPGDARLNPSADSAARPSLPRERRALKAWELYALIALGSVALLAVVVKTTLYCLHRIDEPLTVADSSSASPRTGTAASTSRKSVVASLDSPPTTAFREEASVSTAGSKESIPVSLVSASSLPKASAAPVPPLVKKTPDRLLIAHKTPVRAVAFSTSGETLFTGADLPPAAANGINQKSAGDNVIRIWDAATGTQTASLDLTDSTGADFAVTGSAISTDQDMLAVVCSTPGATTSYLNIYNLQTRARESSAKQQAYPLIAGPWIGTPQSQEDFNGKDVAFWQSRSEELQQKVAAIDQNLTDARNLVSSLKQQQARNGPTRTTPQARQIRSKLKTAVTNAASLDGDKSLADGQLADARGHLSQAKESNSNAQSGTLIFAVQQNATLARYLRSPGSLTRKESVSLSGETSAKVFCMSADRTLLVGGSDMGAITVWKSVDGSIVRNLSDNRCAVEAVTISDDGHLVAAAYADGTARVWNTASADVVCRIKHGAKLRCILFAGNDKMITGSEDNSVILWNLADSRPICRFEGHADSVTALSMSNDRRRLATGSSDRTVRLWDLSGLSIEKPSTVVAQGARPRSPTDPVATPSPPPTISPGLVGSFTFRWRVILC